MSKNSAIAWTHHTFNPWWGCARVSPGCEHCYAEAFAKRTGHKVWGVQAGRRFFGDKHWAEPLKWNAEAEKLGERRRVFCASMADVFEDRHELNNHRGRLFELIEATPHLDWQLLTKRPEHVLRLVPAHWREGFPSNVWMGVTAEDQERANKRVWYLPDFPARVLFVSVEPLLGPVDLTRCVYPGMERKSEFDPTVYLDALRGHIVGPDDMLPRRVNWVIVGGESGPGRRDCGTAVIADVVDQCVAAGCAVFVKQDSAQLSGTRGRLSDQTWAHKEFPA